jgi:hypothetical protein
VIEKRVLEVLRLLGCHSSFRSLGLSGRRYWSEPAPLNEAFRKFIS